ncbi:glycogen branching enzyme [Labilithrix luteola]|uniref:Glycogen branching enzyme n=2 Tax=Labilithrix luteola TaxID=1391654 RepID=A0A0K1PNN2_9BACT|nr:glycogen branching enzyme [Labilithrix luteola]
MRIHFSMAAMAAIAGFLVLQARPAVADDSYDVAADRDRRAAKARGELGARTSVTTVEGVFVLIGPPGFQGAGFDQSVALVRNAMAGYLNGRFDRKPSEAISVYLFPNAQGYERFCKARYGAPCIAHYGFYHPADRSMVMNAGLGLGTLTHELVHPLVESDFPRAPTWLNEGIASVFEQPVIPRPGEIHGAKNWRHPRLRRALTSAEKEHARLDVLFGMADETFRDDAEDLHYAMARYVCQWLDERGKLWPFYRRWRDTVAVDPTGEKAFEAVLGMTPAAANTPWTKWVLTI